jgi:hypothetical protein
MTSRVRVCILALGFALFVAMPAVSAAQGPVTIGVKAGLNIAKLKFEDSADQDNVKSLLGANGGLYLSKPVNDNVSVRVEGLFSQKGAKSEDGSDDGKFKLTYIDVPVLLDFSPASTSDARFHVFTGPQISFNTNAELESGGQSLDFKDEVKSTDFGWVLGVGVTKGRWGADARYGLGLSNIAEEGDNVKNRVFSVNVSVKLK